MKRVTLLLMAMVFSVGLLRGVAAAADKFAFVNLGRTFSEYDKTKEFDKALTAKEKAYSDERDKRVSDIKAMQDKISLLSDKERDAKSADLQSKIKTLQDWDRQKQADLRKEQDDKMKDVLKDIEEVVKKYSEKEGYTLVFNDRVLVYQNKSMDITDKIVEILNREYKK